MLNHDECLQQSEKLADYVRRGGDPRLWWRSKGFSPTEVHRILEAYEEADLVRWEDAELQ